MTPDLYERKAFAVEAVQVTEGNMADVAEWCGGSIEESPEKYKRDGRDHYVKVPISVPPTMQFQERHGMALIDDWVVFGQFGARGGEGWKVYQPRAFEVSFTQVHECEKPCGRVEQTLDHEPCVLGEGHLKGPVKVGCRSFLDYRLA